MSELATGASDPSSVAQPALIQWTPYAYAEIPTYQKCLNRMNYLTSVNPDFTHWRCMDYLQMQCPKPLQYRLVEVGTNYFAVTTAAASSWNREALPAAC